MRYGLVIFDMDGTLTEELLDFAAIRREIGLAEKGGILEGIAGLAEELRVRGEAILERHEMAAAEGCRLRPGAMEVLAGLRARGVRTALLTRNSRACAARIVGRHGLVLDHVGTREDVPHKPHPESIGRIVRQFGAGLGQTLMVGDFLFDLQTAAAAGTDSALLSVRADGKWPEYAGMATYRIRELRELLGIVL
jgi:HAD superfamily hydrolase (TIGR01549 family)